MRRGNRDDWQRDIELERRPQEAERDPAPPPTSGAPALIAALVHYLGPARDTADVRRAINTWRHDVVNAGLRPEQLLVEFKKILVGLAPPPGSEHLGSWEKDRRDMIAICIEEYFR